jgi:hypothetical protein
MNAPLPLAPLLGDADRHALLDAVQRYAHGDLAALTARPEHPMSPTQVGQTLQGLVELGLVNAEAEPACGLWDVPADASLRRFTVEALMRLARVSPAIAYQAHGVALGAHLDRLAGLPPTGGTVPLLDGRWGLGRQALGRALAGATLSADEAAWLADCWSEPQPVADAARLLVAPPDWQALWWPRWTPAQGWAWCRATRERVETQPLPHAHGFDELTLLRVSLLSNSQEGNSQEGRAPDVTLPDPGAARFIELAALHGLGLLAISVGTAQRAIARARDYARLRRQGGKAIIEHAAVQQLLAEAEHAVALAQSSLSALWVQPEAGAPGLPALHAVWRARARLQPQLVDAVSRALQVFGGIGYMRDTGAEKDLRDANTLRLLGGSPTELTLCCAALDELLEGASA